MLSVVVRSARLTGKSFLVEATAKEYSENCRVKLKIIPYGLWAEPSHEFEVYWYPGTITVSNLNPGESVKTQLLRLVLPEGELKHIADLQRAYRSAPDSEDLKYHINLRLMQAYESLEKSVAKCIIDTPEHPSGYRLTSQVNVLILLAYSKSYFSWSPFLFINEAWKDAKPYPIIEYVSRKIVWRKL